jgi:hypothetical protein
MGKIHRLPARQRGKTLQEVLDEFPELKEMGILVDGTERATRRPKDPQKQKERYSGKKKRHCIKNIVISRADNNQIIDLGKTQSGSVHDKKCLEEENLRCRSPVEVGADLGFQGIQIANFKMHLPYKKPIQNRVFSSIRVKVEHAIGGIKRNHSVSDVYRNFKEGFEDTLMSVACGLHNFRMASRAVAACT